MQYYNKICRKIKSKNGLDFRKMCLFRLFSAATPAELSICGKPARSSYVDYALENMLSPFGIADVEQLCPNVSRDTIRSVMNRWREQGRLEILGRGRDARWRRKG